MYPWPWPGDRETPATSGGPRESGERLVADGGDEQNGDETGDVSGVEEESDPAEVIGDEDDEASDVDRSNVEVTDAGTIEPADPKWEKPDPEDIPEVEGPKTRPADSNETDTASGETRGGMAGGKTTAGTDGPSGLDEAGDPTAGMPNTARSPGTSRLEEGAADGYVVALELCARLPEDVRLPEAAADLVPVALEAELEQSVQQFAGEQFDNPSPHVETLDFVEADDDVWLRLRLGMPPEAFADLDPDAIRERALQELDGMM